MAKNLHTAPGRKPPQSATSGTSTTHQKLAHCSCGHSWVLRADRLGRCPGCQIYGAARVLHLDAEFFRRAG